MCKYCKGCGGINAFILIRNATNIRFDKAFQSMLDEYKEMFGNVFFERLIIIATRVDSNINRLQFNKAKQGDSLRKDICDKFNLDINIPVIPIGLENYEESIANLVNMIPVDKFVCQHIKSPIDELRSQHTDIQRQVDTITNEMNTIAESISSVNKSLNAL